MVLFLNLDYSMIFLFIGPEPSILFVVLVMQTVSYNSTTGAYEILPLTQYKCFYRSAICCYNNK